MQMGIEPLQHACIAKEIDMIQVRRTAAYDLHFCPGPDREYPRCAPSFTFAPRLDSANCSRGAVCAAVNCRAEKRAVGFLFLISKFCVQTPGARRDARQRPVSLQKPPSFVFGSTCSFVPNSGPKRGRVCNV